MADKERLRVLKHIMETMTAGEMDDFIYDIWICDEPLTYNEAFKKAVHERI